MSKYCTFPEMQSSLRASAAAGMSTQITLKPDAAKALAEALDLAIAFKERELLRLMEPEQTPVKFHMPTWFWAAIGVFWYLAIIGGYQVVVSIIAWWSV